MDGLEFTLLRVVLVRTLFGVLMAAATMWVPGLL
jgi:hypothetical protein